MDEERDDMSTLAPWRIIVALLAALLLVWRTWIWMGL
jgi:hypothetical protein